MKILIKRIRSCYQLGLAVQMDLPEAINRSNTDVATNELNSSYYNARRISAVDSNTLYDEVSDM